MENSNTQKITTEDGKVIELRTFITFGEKRMINDAFNNAAVYQDGKRLDSSMAAQLNASTDKAIEIVVVSIDGKTENIVDTFMKLPNRSALKVIEMVSEVTDNKKKEPATPTT